MKFPRKAVIDRQADHIRDTFDNVDDKLLATLAGGQQARYGIALPPRDPVLPPTTDGSQPQPQPSQPGPTVPPLPTTGDLLPPLSPLTNPTLR